MLARAFAVTFAFVALGCAGESTGTDEPPTFEKEALSTLHAGALTIEVRTSPAQPPSRGESSVELTVTGEDGQTEDGLDVSADPWMPAMGHGAATDPERVVEAGGRYRFDRVEMFMPGEWELRLDVAGKTEDRATAHFKIP
jgi:hypothetical protein